MSALARQLISAAPLQTRMRWYAEMNTWRAPSDFPIPLPSFANREDQHKDLQWRAAWDAISSALTEEEQSLGWWLYELKRTEPEWRAWWNGERAAKRKAEGAT